MIVRLRPSCRPDERPSCEHLDGISALRYGKYGILSCIGNEVLKLRLGWPFIQANGYGTFFRRVPALCAVNMFMSTL